MSLFALQSVSKSYGALKVTDDISLSVTEGETLGILGLNGAGKTTLFNLISGDARCNRSALAVYVVAAFGCGLAGALYFVGNLRISPDVAFSVNWTAFAIFMVVIGGIGRIEGLIVGALIFWALSKFFSDYGTWYLLGLGLLAIVVTTFFKQGLWGWAQQRYGWSLLPTQRRLRA